jgi:nucleotide-binding universal stress UspA family protein
MEIVVASIGLSLGILSTQMFSIIVMVAIVTSFMAPVGLRLTMPRVRMTEEETKRILASASMGAFDPQRLRILLATGGGPSAIAAASLAFGLGARSDSPLAVVYAEVKTGWWKRIVSRVSKVTPGKVSQHIEALKSPASNPWNDRAPDIRRVSARTVAQAICEEASRGYDLIFVGSGDGAAVGGAIVEEIVAEAPCHVAIMKVPADVRPNGAYKNILVPVDGSVASRTAVDLALRYAEATKAALSLAVITERRPQAAAYADVSGTHPISDDDQPAAAEELERISVVFRASAFTPTILHLAYDPQSSAVAQAVEKGQYDLVIVGAENRAIQHRLFFGYDNERLIRATRVPVLVVVPNLASLARSGSGNEHGV